MKTIIYYVVWMVLAVGTFVGVVVTVEHFKPVDPNIAKVKHDIDSLKIVSDSTKARLARQDEYVAKLEQVIRDKKDIIIINKRYEAIVDSVRDLDVDGDIKFFTEYLSQNDSIK